MKLTPLLTLLLTLLLSTGASAQAPDRPHAGEIYAGLEKMQVLGSALYLAAHPDDENTRLIAYMANVEKAETAYLSLTGETAGKT